MSGLTLALLAVLVGVILLVADVLPSVGWLFVVVGVVVAAVLVILNSRRT